MPTHQEDKSLNSSNPFSSIEAQIAEIEDKYLRKNQTYKPGEEPLNAVEERLIDDGREIFGEKFWTHNESMSLP